MLITKVSSTNYEDTPPHTFGHAHLFSPWPNTVVGAHCKWEVILNTVYNRIPRTITEIVCQTPNVTCGGNTNYQVIFEIIRSMSMPLLPLAVPIILLNNSINDSGS